MKTAVLWMTGLSGAGKTTIAQSLLQKIQKLGYKVEILDGDVIRNIFPATGFTEAERNQHVKRVGYIASLLEKHGVIVIGSLISPYQESRDFIRGLCKNYIEIHVSTPLNICESRDPKGLYKRARNGEIKNFTGIDDPYEAPTRPDIVLDTSVLSLEDCVQTILAKLQQ